MITHHHETTNMPDTQLLLQVNDITFAASDVLTVSPIVKHPWNPPTFQYTFLVTLRDCAGKAQIEWCGAKFQDRDRFPEWERDACQKANHARNAVIQAAWPNGHVSVIDGAGEVQP